MTRRHSSGECLIHVHEGYDGECIVRRRMAFREKAKS